MDHSFRITKRVFLILTALAITGVLAAKFRRVYVEGAIGARLLFVPPGSFMMGSRFADTVGEAERSFFTDEIPPHEVTITKGFWLAESEITVAQFRKFIEETGYVTSAERRGFSLGKYSVTTDDAGKSSGSWTVGNGLSWRESGLPVTDLHPVAHVSWDDADAFCRWLSKKTGRQYRLPTEAEWEYAAGGPDRRLYAWGSELPSGARGGNIADASFAQTYPEWKYPVTSTYNDGHPGYAPVGSFAPNGFGILDMSGNVWEWTGDLYSPTYYSESPRASPTGPSSAAPDIANLTARPRRVHRGGGFDWELSYLRVAKRRALPQDSSAINIGFRIARDTPATQQRP